MQNPDQFILRNRGAARGSRFGDANFEVLVAFPQGIEMKSVSRVGEKNLRPHFGVNRLRVDVGEGDAENERTQIIDIRDAAESSERTLGHKMCVFAALILPWTDR